MRRELGRLPLSPVHIIAIGSHQTNRLTTTQQSNAAFTRAAEMLAIYCPPFGGHLDEPLPGPAASAVLAYYLCVRAATYEILKDHPVPVDVSNPRVDVSNLRIGGPDSPRDARPQ